MYQTLSEGEVNERRDREAKLKLYSPQGVKEYWIVSRELQQVEVYRRENVVLKRAATYKAEDVITPAEWARFHYLAKPFFFVFFRLCVKS